MRLVASTKAFLVVALFWPSLVGSVTPDTLYLDIDKCVELAIGVNWTIVKARLQLEKSASSILTACSDLLPRVSLQSTHSKYEDYFLRQVGDRVVLTDRSYTAAFSLSYSLRFSSTAQVMQTIAYRDASRESLQRVKQEIAYQAKEKYLNMLKAKKVIDVRREALERSLRRLDRAKFLFEIGSAVKADVLKAEVEVGNSRLALMSAENALWLAESDLKHFLSIDQETPIVVSDIVDLPVISRELNEVAAISSRPDILAAKAKWRASKFGVWAGRGGWFPVVSFDFRNNYTGDGFPDRLTTLYDQAKWSWGFTLYFDLFDGLYTLSRVKEAKVSREIARMDLEELLRSASLEVRQAYHELEQARERLVVSRRTVELAEEELRLAEESYNLGAISMLELIDAQVNLSEAKESYIEALYDLLLADARLSKAGGKGLR
ncbi:MAG: TolC family protein [bacterium]